MGPMGSVAWERAIKVQEVMLRAVGKKITWWQAAEIIGISDRQMRRWHRRYEKWGYESLSHRTLSEGDLDEFPPYGATGDGGLICFLLRNAVCGPYRSPSGGGQDRDSLQV
jgi:hypothetical protein